MSSHPSVAVAVASYNRRGYLPRFVDACLGSEGLEQLVVAVDGSDDGSMEWLESTARVDSRVTPVWVDHQGQFGALDTAVRTAGTDVVLLLDDDVELQPTTVRGHAAHHQAQEHLVVLGYMPTVLPSPATAKDFATVIYDREYEARCAAYERDPSTVLTNLWGGHVSLRRSDYLALGYEALEPPPGGEHIRLYHQDTEFGLRCRSHGMTGVFDRSLVARHHHRRAAAGFLSDAFGRGAVAVLIADHHPEVSLPVGTKNGPGVVGRVLGRPPIERPLSVACSWSVEAAIRTGSLPLTIGVAKLARRLRLRQGETAMEMLVQADRQQMNHDE